jgi:hypothetical protein
MVLEFLSLAHPLRQGTNAPYSNFTDQATSYLIISIAIQGAKLKTVINSL